MPIDTGLGLTFNENFPLVGVDNDSQIFRDNFEITKRAIENIHGATAAASSSFSFSQTVGSGGDVRVTVGFKDNAFAIPYGAPTGSPGMGMVRTNTVSQIPQFHNGTLWLNFAVHDGLGGLQLPGGSAGLRPVNPEEGMIRYNSDDKSIEFFNGNIWSETGIAANVTDVEFRVTNLESEVDDARNGNASVAARFYTIDTTIATANAATASRVATLESEVTNARSGNSTLLARFSSIDNTIATANSATTNRVTTLESEVANARGDNATLLARFSEIDTTIANANVAYTGQITTLESEIVNARGGNATLLARFSAIDTTLATANSATASRVATLESEVTNARSGNSTLLARFSSIDNTIATANTATTSRVATLESEITNARSGNATLLARFNSIDTTIATANTATSSRITSLQSEVTNARGGNATLLARFSSIDNTIATANTASSSRITNLESEITNARSGNATLLARFNSIDTTIATANSATASSISSLSSTVGSHSTTITSHTSSINGLAGRWGIHVNNNGVIAGISLNSYGTGIGGTPQSNFVVQADKIVLTNSTGTGSAPFEIVGGQTRIKDAMIQNLTVDKLGSGTTSAQINLGTGLIIGRNAGTDVIMGSGFGANSNLLFWAGPTQANTNLCSSSNSIFHILNNGDAYFGGSLSAGVLTNKISTSNISPTATTETGQFGSNGGTITVTLSYSAYRNYSYYDGGDVGSPPSNQSGSTSGTVVLARAVSGGSYANVTTLNTSGTWSDTVGEFEVGLGWHHTYVYNLGGSLTYTDPDTNTNDRQYKASITSRTGGLFGPSSQTLSIICVE